MIYLDPTIIRTKTSKTLLNLLSKCEKYLKQHDSIESISIQSDINRAKEIYKEEIGRIYYKKRGEI
tara:strand:+ start:5229 stop:5426 length:198 start_codon:yes stop_codon:yes gene_type:complete